MDMTDQESKPFAELLRERRRQMDLSQAAAARLVGASEKSWRRWEQGAMPDDKFLDAIEQTYGLTASVSPGKRVIDDLERAVAAVREALGRVRADIILRRPDGDSAIVAIRAGEELQREAIGIISHAAHDAGWTVHIAPIDR